jgi:signal transduction histidine kinase
MVQAAMENGIEHDRPYDLQFRIVRADGSERILRDNAELIRDHNDRPIRWQGAVLDITELKRTQEALRDREAHYRDIFDEAPGALWIEDWSRIKQMIDRLAEEGVEDWHAYFANNHDRLAEAYDLAIVLECSNANLEIYGASSTEALVVATRAGQVVPAQLDEFAESLIGVIEGRPSGINESLDDRMDGTKFLLRSQYVIPPAHRHDWSRIIYSLEDVTDRRRAEEEVQRLNEELERRVKNRTKELRESEMRLRDALEALPAGFSLYDREDRLILCNGIYEDYVFHDMDSVPLGATFEEILKEKISRGHYPETAGREAEWLAERLRTHHETSGPIEQMHSNGRWYWIDERRISEGSIAVVSLDITERKRLEGDLLRQERLATLGQLAATVSHELRNPLGTIRNSAFVLRQGCDGESPCIKRSLERIERSIIRCDRIIGEMLDFTRVSDLVLESTAIDAWLEETLNEQALPSGVALRLKFGMPDMAVSFDHDRFRRAIINVFDNGCQAMVEEGPEDVCTEAHSLTVRTQEHDGRIEVIFEDTGPGIPPDVYERIFEPLYSTKGFGVGLGLTVVKQIMEQHGGGIEIENEEGQGTRVCLWLPTSRSTHGLRAHGGP